MKNRVLILAFVALCLVVVLLGATKPWGARDTGAKGPAPSVGLKDQIVTIYDRSVEECSVSNPSNSECVKTQFFLNYRYYVLKEVPSAVGAPGVPGPMSGH